MKQEKKKGMKGLGVCILVFALTVGIFASKAVSADGAHELKNPVLKAVEPPEGTSHGLSNPRNENETVTWDCVYFGNYWQNNINENGTADKNDEKEPIKWSASKKVKVK